MNTKKENLLKEYEKNEIQRKIDNKEIDVTQEAEEDYFYIRERLKKLIEKSEYSLDQLIAFAEESEHPRTYEVLSNMFAHNSNILNQLLELSKKRKEIVDENNNKNNNSDITNNNAIFVGSTEELQKFLKQNNNE